MDPAGSSADAPAAVVQSRAAALPNVRALAVRYVAEEAELQVPEHHRYDAVLDGVVPGPRGYAACAEFTGTPPVTQRTKFPTPRLLRRV